MAVGAVHVCSDQLLHQIVVWQKVAMNQRGRLGFLESQIYPHDEGSLVFREDLLPVFWRIHSKRGMPW